MHRFRFRLERLLELRRYREREWELKLAAATGQCLMIEQEIKSRQKETLKKIRGRSWAKGYLDLNSLFSTEIYLTRLDREIRLFTEELEIKRTERKKVQNTYLDASKHRKVLEKLKARREREYYEEQKKEDFKVQDDITTGSMARRKVTGG